jgi:hypothetical protein
MQVIKKHTNSFQKYIDKLLTAGTVTEEEVSAVQNRVHRILQEEFDMAKEYVPKKDDWLSNVWAGFKTPSQRSRIRNTGLVSALFFCLQIFLLDLPDLPDLLLEISLLLAACVLPIRHMWAMDVSGHGKEHLEWTCAHPVMLTSPMGEHKVCPQSWKVDGEWGIVFCRSAVRHAEGGGHAYLQLP